jgi:formylglycine-generating enzyme required for sulfatase activity
MHHVTVDAFEIDVDNVTNAEFMRFVDAGGYRDARWWTAEDWQWIQLEEIRHPHFWHHLSGQWYWRGMFERVELPPDWPVYVTWAEATAYARWLDRRLPTEADFHRAAFGTHQDGQRFPWGNDLPERIPANVDFGRWDPVNVGTYADGVSRYGVHDLVGNGWEWTATPFAPFEGFVATPLYPEYSAEFFDAAHYVLKGGSPVTARELIRPGFRNWFRPHYPYVYATFRCVRSL